MSLVWVRVWVFAYYFVRKTIVSLAIQSDAGGWIVPADLCLWHDKKETKSMIKSFDNCESIHRPVWFSTQYFDQFDIWISNELCTIRVVNMQLSHTQTIAPFRLFVYSVLHSIARPEQCYHRNMWLRKATKMTNLRCIWEVHEPYVWWNFPIATRWTC